MLETRELSPDFGVEIQNVVLTEIVGATADAILSAAAEHALLLFRRQSLHDEDIYRLSSALGSVEEPAAKVNHSPRFKEINYIGNINSLDGSLIGSPIENTDGGWHSDQAFRSHPATLSTLFCVIAPEVGGSTSFCSTRLGYEAVPESLKHRLAKLRGRYAPANLHEVAKVETTHPAVLENPANGRKTLYVSPNMRGFEGLEDDESEALKAEVLRYLLRPEHIHSHHWRMGDMLIYDNAQLLHKRDAFEGIRFLKASRVFVSPERFAVPD